jgi:NAD(P)-dependent dehydrogenase (short-subunit alcohol dehydrogenase family)
VLLEGKSTIVTGAGSGIGRASAIRFAAEGAAVVVADIRLGRASETADAITEAGGRAVPVEVDVRRADDTERMIGTAVEHFGGLHALFNNAGTIRPGNAVQLSEDDWHLVMDTNVTSIFLAAKYAVPAMTDGGAIISTASVSGMRGDPASIVYGASKAAVINLAQVMAVEGAAHGIRVNALCPGPVQTPLVARLHTPETRAEWLRQLPMRRYGTPDEMAPTALFLLDGRKSGYLTGQAVSVDGGYAAAGLMPPVD